MLDQNSGLKDVVKDFKKDEKTIDEKDTMIKESNKETSKEEYIYDKKIYKYNNKALTKYVLKFKNKNKLQKYEQLNNILNNESISYLIKILKKRIFKKKNYTKRLFKEFKLILNFNFEQVFVQVHQILELAKDIPHIIRGSAGSCLLCYYMGITEIDPIKENITLSRFMHTKRADIPDIDIDFPSHLRDKIYKKIFDNWKDKVARISNHIMFKEKSAIREAIRQEGHRKFVPRDFDLTDIFKDKKQIIKVVNNAARLLGNFKCYSLHCGGIVIFPCKVPTNLILKKFDIDDNNTGDQIWMNKDQVEDADMIKIDILSNRGLSQLMEISDKKLETYDINDKKTLEIFSNGNNIGLTHAESRAMMKVFKTIKPKTIKEVAIAIALIRPAAAKNYQKAEFLRDYTPYKYDTKNFIIFDDDATIFIKKLLDCNFSEADNYRRAFSKNKKYEIGKFKNLLKNIIGEKDVRDKIIERLEQLHYYSFCKSHAYSYAQLIWALAYQKANNSKAFWLSTLNNCNSSYRKWVHFREARLAGIKLCLGKKPYILDDDKLVSLKELNKKPKKTKKKKKNELDLKTPVGQLINEGYWISDKFLPGMYYNEYWSKLTKRHKKLEKTIINDGFIKYASFKGLIVTGRGCKKENGKGFITFVTIASDDGVYHDLVLQGYHKISKMLCLSGYGKIKTDSYCRWIDVAKYNSVWLT